MKKEIKTIIESKTFGNSIIGIGIFFILGLVFATGVRIGYHKARFAGSFGDNYTKTFEGRNRPEMFRGELPGGHGVAGKVLSIALPNIIVLDRDGTEKTIHTTDKTLVRRFRDSITLQNIQVDDFIVGIGSPNETSQIDARLIRVLPEPPGDKRSEQLPTNINK